MKEVHDFINEFPNFVLMVLNSKELLDFFAQLSNLAARRQLWGVNLSAFDRDNSEMKFIWVGLFNLELDNHALPRFS